MKIAVTSQGPELGSNVDPRFGRAPYILIVDTDTWECQVIDNRENANSLRGAGIEAASSVSKSGAEVLLTGHCGPNAFKALKASNIKVANNAEGTVKEAVKAYLDGKLQLADDADVDGHW